jgi:Ca-activated chloride channel homolog
MKASRLVLLAAAPLCCAILMGETALAANASSAWSNLWRTPDQQGQALLDAGQPAQAAERFHDERRRAYADLEAGRYRDAAKLLAPFTDAQSEYNRGNALAKSGLLQAALASYDAALKQAPADKDIRRNRDLVERALRQQHESPQSSSHGGRQGDQGGASTGQRQQSTAGQQGGSGSQQSGARGSQSGNDQAASSGSQAGGNQQGDSGRQGSGQSNSAQGSSAPQAADAYGSGSSKEAPGQAQRDAALAAAMARKQQQGGIGNTAQGQAPDRNAAAEQAAKRAGKTPNSRDLLAGGTQTPKQKPETERQLALDQWLRQIPDSPAGLLQRKFLIEHMMRQQGSEDPQAGGDQQGSGP